MRVLAFWALAGALSVVVAANCRAALVHQYTFNAGDASDSVGSADGVLVDPGGLNGGFQGGLLDLTGNDGENSQQDFGGSSAVGAYVDLPNGIVSSAAAGGVAGAVSIEAWVRSEVNRNWAAIFSAGTSPGGEDVSGDAGSTDWLQLIAMHDRVEVPGSPNNTLRVTSHGADQAEGLVDYVLPLSTSALQHVVATYDQSASAPGVISLYVDGAKIGDAAISANLNVSAFADNNIWLGRSQWQDSLFDGWYDEVRIYSHSLSPSEVQASFVSGPTAVPEPAGLALVAVSALAAFPRRAA